SPRILSLPTEYGSRLAGCYPYAILALAVCYPRRAMPAGKWLFYSVIYLVALGAMPSHKVDGAWVTLVPHIFRYLCAMSIPLVLALTAYVRELPRSVWSVAIVGAFLALSVRQAGDLSWATRDAFGEQRRAIAFLQTTFPDELVVSDFGFTTR